MAGLRCAFTTVELLLVLGIIAVLAGLIFTGGTMARRKVNSAHCQANLLQLGVAMKAYVADHGTLPLVHYEPSFQVPGQVNQEPRRPPSPPRDHDLAVVLGGYVSDARLFQCPATQAAWPGQVYALNPSASGLKMSQVRTPPHRALILTDVWQDDTWRLHGGARNVLFLDGHVKSYRGAVWQLQVYLPNDEESGKWPWD
jgi:prepilin-type processing-associated H-X9-DG protein